MTIPLPATCDTEAAATLLAAARAAAGAGRPLAFDGAGVERVGQACLQVLASARATAAAGGLAYQVDDPSPALVEMAALAALDVLTSE